MAEIVSALISEADCSVRVWLYRRVPGGTRLKRDDLHIGLWLPMAPSLFSAIHLLATRFIYDDMYHYIVVLSFRESYQFLPAGFMDFDEQRRKACNTAENDVIPGCFPRHLY